MAEFRVIGDIASELLAEIRGGQKKMETAGKALSVIASDSPGRGYKQNETTVGLRRSKVGKIADTVEGSSPSIKGETFASLKHRPQGRNNGR